MCRPLVVDVPVIMQLKFQQSFVVSVEVPQIPFIDRVVDFVASQRQGHTVQIVQKTGDSPGAVQFLDWDMPVVVQRQGRMVQTVQSGGAAGAVLATLWTSLRSCRTSRSPGEAGRCLRFSSSPELSASCSRGALDDEEFFVIEGSGVALTPGVGLPGVGPPGAWVSAQALAH